MLDNKILKKEMKALFKKDLNDIKNIYITNNEKYSITDIFITYGIYRLKQVKINVIDKHIHSINGDITLYLLNDINDILKEMEVIR